MKAKLLSTFRSGVILRGFIIVPRVRENTRESCFYYVEGKTKICSGDFKSIECGLIIQWWLFHRDTCIRAVTRFSSVTMLEKIAS